MKEFLGCGDGEGRGLGVDSVYSDLVQDPWDGGALPLGTGMVRRQ